MGFFDNLKSSLTETGQDLSQKAKDTTEIFRLTNLNKTKEKEIGKSHLSDRQYILCQLQGRMQGKDAGACRTDQIPAG